jgi:hypothetical protein
MRSVLVNRKHLCPLPKTEIDRNEREASLTTWLFRPGVL